MESASIAIAMAINSVSSTGDAISSKHDAAALR